MPQATSLRRAHIEQIVSLFSAVPTLRQVAVSQVQAALDQRHPSLNLLAERVAIGTPRQAGEYHYSRLADEVLMRLACARPLRYVEDHHQVLLRQREVYGPGGPALADIEQLVNQLGPDLLQAWLVRLQDWWRETVPVDTTRWAYLSDDLLMLLYDSQKPAGMDEQQFSRLFPRALLRASRPDRQWSVQGTALKVQALFVRRQGSAQVPQMLPLLVLDHRMFGAELRTLLLFSPATGLHPLAQLEEVAPLLAGYVGPRLAGAALEWFAEEPVGDPFDALAASYAERQCTEVLAIDRTVPRTPDQYQALLDYVTDPNRWFESVLTPLQLRMQDELPLWLAHASPQDSLAYAGELQALVQAQAEAAGKTFLDGIEPLRTFAAKALKRCLGTDSRAHGIAPDDIELTYTLVTAAVLPGGFTSGDVHSQNLSLTDLALENLGGFPHTPSRIRLKGATAPGWLTAALLTGCVTEVDIGQVYPELLRQKLINDPAERTWRAALFTRQLRAQLPLLALEMQLKGEGGLTQAGYRLVKGALQPGAAERTAAIWPLAFKATPTATADEVVNMYVIGPRDTEQGPHLLYRPLFSPGLHEFESLAQLLDAICEPGELQAGILAWMAPDRQAVYAQGGFLEPHIRRFLAGDEFSVPERPAPARLSKRVADGDPLPRLFASTAQALVSLAQAQSVSNREQRWATLKTAGWLLFDTLLPFVRGPALLVGWLVQMLGSVKQDMLALAEDDPAAQAQGVTDLLTNLVMVLAYRASPHEWPAPLDRQHPAFARTRLVKPAPAVVRGPESVQLDSPYRWCNARETMTGPMQARLQAMSLKAFAAPWPRILPGAETTGRLKGLVRDATSVPPQWQALVRGHLYRVEVTGSGVEVTNADGSVRGPLLKSGRDGTWDVDLRLRLLGGQPDSPQEPLAPEARRLQLEQDYARYAQRREAANRAMMVARQLSTRESTGITEQQRAAAQERYGQELHNKLQASLLELQCLKDLQAIKSRAGYERELCTLLEGVILNLQQLLQHARGVAVAIHARLVPALRLVEHESEEEAQSTINQQAHHTILQGLQQLADSNEQAIRWRSLELGSLDELGRVPKYGRDTVEALHQGRREGPSVLELQSLQVSALWAVAINNEGPQMDEEFLHSLNDTVDRARWASGSQAQLDELAPQSPPLRLELLESFDRVYAQTDDRIEFWRAMEPDQFNLGYLDKLQQLFAQLHLQVQHELAATLAPAAPTPAPTVARPRQKKIIRTRNRDMYVAQVQVMAGEQPVEVAQVTDARDEVIASFVQAADGIWEPLQKTQARRTASAPNLNRLLEHGQALRAQVDKAIAEVLKMAGKANEPQSLQDILEQRADKLRRCADAIQQRLLHSEPQRLAATQKARARTEADELRAAASRLSEQGLQARLNAIRARPPTQGGLEVLVMHDEVRIFRQGARVALAGRANDWLQAYVVLDVHSRQALCYGHFHYERPSGPDDHFTAAHLKTPAQHRLGKQSQAQAQAQAFASLQAGQGGRVTQTLAIHRGEVNLRMARKLFFDAPAWVDGEVPF
ncbi:hypothetical protein SAMN04490207_4984 [Pseudomonas gessardii]|uniref:Uncharacterized protein n=1 Tax=Pseudomonas gessardii TaxID=78544 RepID=A0A7Y1MU92_9PSED|nr:hypothetical protein [Pseudomonas gessardii]MRU50631.1 hypothetical protein [Pseudomonas gessardii]NNA98410.1 hypothetical protein [Pseudomonas gessardii]ONH44338.1 hypothetical protein BLL38_09690 [Pseudomonas gessardii]SDR31403.1 hypothetical protein SAMN04490207_4984 [Pseudomonas gessardii]